jgi:hypothetical protein
MPTPQEYIASMVDRLKKGQLKLGELKRMIADKKNKGTMLGDGPGQKAADTFERYVNSPQFQKDQKKK